MGDLGGITFLIQHPIIGLIVFLAVSAGVLMLFSGGNLLDALRQLLRVALTFFTTPFVFLRDSLATLRRSEDEERAYAQSRLFTLFRVNRLFYLGILTASLLTLSGGITKSLVSLWPSEEFARAHAQTEHIKQLREQIAVTETSARAAGDSSQRTALETRRNDARRAYEQEAATTGDLLRNTSFSGGLITEIARAQGPEEVARVAASIDGYLADCPGGPSWQGFAPETCAQLRVFVTELARRKTNEQTLARAYQEAEKAFQDADTAARTAEQTLADLKQQLEAAQQLRSEVSLFNPRVIGGKLWGAILGLLGTLLAVVGIVWSGAIFIDIFNWVILLMRSAEKTHAPRVGGDNG